MIAAMRLGLVVAPLLVSATAYAQAPGEVDPTTPPAYEEPTPVASNPCGGGRDVMRNRIGIGINIGGFSAANPEAAEGEPTTDFSTAELAIRYRMSPRFELELLLSGGRQVLEDGNDGDLAMGGGTLGLRYRMRPNRAWDW